ncbi:hypothetical protein AB0C84_35975 [Actinomadura sp. NPDC048955]|uniref:hypothetical protein n=1 Tax=Actinomadura sp. NPDC048955 TaxID=3158228 RepID=UPI0033EEA3DC
MRFKGDEGQGMGRPLGPFRPQAGPNVASGVLAELARLWDRAVHRGGQVAQERLARQAKVPLTTVNSWSTGRSLPRDVDQLARTGAVLADWAGETPGTQAAWSRLLEADKKTRTGLRPRRGADGAGVGWPLDEVRDPFALEVHHAVESPAGVAELPVYVPRAHDDQLAQVVRDAAAGGSAIAVLVGGSSTGKTRACWEALQLLRGRAEPWRVWHPIAPARPDAALAELDQVGPRTVVWLNEAQFYLADPVRGERVAAGLRAVLRDRARGPVLVLATLWPTYWGTLTSRPTGGPDRHAQARELLEGRRIQVPEAFGAADLERLTARAGQDPRLAEAAARAGSGRITQYLAGVPVLLDRYDTATPITRALIHAAMDARRLGCGPHLPLALLTAAAPGYLDDTQWALTPADWPTQTLEYLTAPCNGIPGILTPFKTDQRNRRPQRTGAKLADPVSGPVYQLADYLDQHGSTHRADHIPPVAFWTAAADHAHPTDQHTLGDAAWDRGLYRDAAQLHKNATTYGNPRAARSLVVNLHQLHPADHRPAAHAVAHAPLEDPVAVAGLLEVLREAGANEQVEALVARDPAAHAGPNEPVAFVRLLEMLLEVGAQKQVAALADRAATHATVDNPGGVALLLEALRKVGAQKQVIALAGRAATHVTVDDPDDVCGMLEALLGAGAQKQMIALADRAAAGVALDDLGALARLVEVLRNAGAHKQMVALAGRAAPHAALENLSGLGLLLRVLRKAGAQEQVVALADRAAAHAALDNPVAVARLLRALQAVGAVAQVEALVARDPAAHAALDDPGTVARLLEVLRQVGAQEQATALVARDPAAHTALDDPRGLGLLLRVLWEVGAREQVVALADRAAAHAALDDPDTVAQLLEALRTSGLQKQMVALVDRAAAHAALDDPDAVARLLGVLQTAGARKQIAALIAREPAAHTELDNSPDVARLVRVLWEVGADEQVTTLTGRAAAHVALDSFYAVGGLLRAVQYAGTHEQLVALADRITAHAVLEDPFAVAWLLAGLREARLDDCVRALIGRLPAVGMFDLFSAEGGHAVRYRFGREPDGSSASRWGWEELW